MIPAVFLLAALSSLQPQAEPVRPALTKLESMQMRSGSVIVRTFQVIGFAGRPNEGTVRVECDVITDSVTGEKEYGVILRLSPANERDSSIAYLDYDEIQPLIRSLDEMSRTTAAITELPSFEAVYRTRGGIEIRISGDRGGMLHPSLTNVFILPTGLPGQQTVFFNPVGLSELGNLISTAK